MASRVFAKLNLKDQTEILVIDAPTSFEAELDHLEDVRVRRKLTPGMSVSFALVFVTSQAGIDAVARPLARAAAGDAIIWFAYPKGTSKNYTSTINRDRGWNALGDTAVALGTGLGAMLPFAAVLALVGLPAWFSVRRIRARGRSAA